MCRISVYARIAARNLVVCGVTKFNWDRSKHYDADTNPALSQRKNRRMPGHRLKAEGREDEINDILHGDPPFSPHPYMPIRAEDWGPWTYVGGRVSSSGGRDARSADDTCADDSDNTPAHLTF